MWKLIGDGDNWWPVGSEEGEHEVPEPVAGRGCFHAVGRW